MSEAPPSPSIIRSPALEVRVDHDSGTRYSAEIVGHEIREDENRDKYCCYELEITDHQTNLRNIVFRRYGEFADLRTKLIQQYPELSHVAFPPKRWFSQLSPNTISERKEGLQRWLQHLLSEPRYRKNLSLLQFINSDMQMLKQALSFFRAKLYNIRQRKRNPSIDELEEVETKVRALDNLTKEEIARQLRQRSSYQHQYE